MKEKSKYLAIKDGSAKKARRETRRKLNTAVTEDNTPLPDREIAKPKISTDTGHTRLATEDKVKTNAAPKMSTTDIFKKIQFTKEPPEAPPKAIPKHDIELDEEKSEAYWLKRPRQCIVEQLRLRGAALAVSTLIRRNRDMCVNMLLDMIA